MFTLDRTKIRNLTILAGSTLHLLASLTIAPALPDMALASQNVPMPTSWLN